MIFMIKKILYINIKCNNLKTKNEIKFKFKNNERR